jgi:hypothetical protein
MNRRQVIKATAAAIAAATLPEIEEEPEHFGDFIDPDGFLGLPRPPCEWVPDELLIFLEEGVA